MALSGDLWVSCSARGGGAHEVVLCRKLAECSARRCPGSAIPCTGKSPTNDLQSIHCHRGMVGESSYRPGSQFTSGRATRR